jgi:hypothetical protein
MSLPSDDLFPLPPDLPQREPDPAATAEDYPALVQLLAAAGALGRTRILELARACGIREASARAYTGESLAAALASFAHAGLVGRGEQGYRCAPAHVAGAFVQASAAGRLAQWLPHLRHALGIDRPHYYGGMYFRTADDAVGAARLALCALTDAAEIDRVLLAVSRTANPAEVYRAALGDPFAPALAALMQPALRDAVLDALLVLELSKPSASAARSVEWTATLVASADAAAPLQYRLAEHRLWQDRGAEALALVENATDAFGLAIRGMAAVLAGDPAAACELYAQSLRGLREAGKRPGGEPAQGAGLQPVRRLPHDPARPARWRRDPLPVPRRRNAGGRAAETYRGVPGRRWRTLPDQLARRRLRPQSHRRRLRDHRRPVVEPCG